MAFTTSSQETEWALLLQPRSPHGALDLENTLRYTVTSSEYVGQVHICRSSGQRHRGGKSKIQA